MPKDKPRNYALLTVKMAPDTYLDFSTVAALRGATLSSIVHQYAVQLIRAEKERNPSEFARKAVEVEKELAANKAARRQSPRRRPAAPRLHHAAGHFDDGSGPNPQNTAKRDAAFAADLEDIDRVIEEELRRAKE